MLNKILIILVISLLQISCASNSPKDTIFKGDWDDMDEIFHSTDKQDASIYGRSFNGNIGYTRTADNELSHLFKVAKNKRVSIYVYPHLTDNHPVPGYTTSIFLFKNSENYLLSGEE